MPQYAILLFSPAPGDADSMPADELAAHEGFGDTVAELGGRITGGEALVSSAEAVSVRGGIVSDGPFAEAKEVIAGFFILQARDRDHAVEIARRNPATWRGGVEIRELFAG